MPTSPARRPSSSRPSRSARADRAPSPDPSTWARQTRGSRWNGRSSSGVGRLEVATIRYTDFDVEVATEPDGFRASVLKSPAGEGASVRFPPVDPAALTTLLGSVGSARDAVHVHQPPPTATLDTTKGFGGD